MSDKKPDDAVEAVEPESEAPAWHCMDKDGAMKELSLSSDHESTGLSTDDAAARLEDPRLLGPRGVVDVVGAHERGPAPARGEAHDVHQGQTAPGKPAANHEAESRVGRDMARRRRPGRGVKYVVL